MSGNWNPVTVPNGLADVATFDLSDTTSIALSAQTELSEIIFEAAAVNGISITVGPPFALTVSGMGCTNSSGTTHNFLITALGTSAGLLRFANGADAGIGVVVTNGGGQAANANGGITQFKDGASAGFGSYINVGGQAFSAGSGITEFRDHSSAAHANILNKAASNPGGLTRFFDHATASDATLSAEHRNDADPSGNPGRIQFFNNSDAGRATFLNGGTMSF